MSAPAITVVGSINLDLVFDAPRLPREGETVTGATLTQLPGGKGANQALAARRLGADVALIGRVGDDAQAARALEALRDAGVDLDGVVRDAQAATGIAVVTVGPGGGNQIVVASGANASVRADDVRAAGVARGRRSGVLCQLELPDAAIAQASRLVCDLFCINAAPARMLESELLQRADAIVVNQIEREQLAGELDGFGGLLATTLGAEGAILERAGFELARATPPPVEVVDTTGAGDAFSGALVVGLLERRSHEEALARACAAGAAATTRRGAQPGLPSAAQIDALLAG